MRRIKHELSIDYNKIFCGYLRQPIFASALEKEKGYGIAGTCCLRNYSVCYRVITKNALNPLESNNKVCEHYRNMVLNPKDK